MPHGLTVSHNDDIWVTDVALHQVGYSYSIPALTLAVAITLALTLASVVTLALTLTP